MKFLATSAVFLQPCTRPFRFVVYEVKPGEFVCHWQYVDKPGHFEHGTYGDLATAMSSFAVRTSTHYAQTIECKGEVSYETTMPYELQPS